MSRLSFKLEAQASGSHARAGRFRTLHNEVLTPLFMPVGTQATVKSQRVETLQASGSQVLLANTYHLLLRPGPEVFKRAGGIHKFMNWNKSVLTDSGGFQVFSLRDSLRMTEEGATFRSHLDNSIVKLTPERSIEMQKAIGSDIMMVLDECVPSTCDHVTAERAMHLTHRWAKRSLEARGDSPQSMFGIVQGACFEDLRRISAATLTDLPFDGFAIGGLAVGETKSQREDFCELTAQLLPADRPRYLMGVGTPIDLLEAVHRGVDMFDCIIPTALAQQGVAYTSRGRVRLGRGIYTYSQDPLDPDCACPACTGYSRSYLRHLIKTGEILGWTLVGEHNLHFYHRLMGAMRQAILEGRFARFYAAMRPRLEADDEDNPVAEPKRSKPKRDRHPMHLGDYEVFEGSSGFAYIRQKSSGEAMHPAIDPREEARRLYIDQSRLAEKLAQPGDELVLWDVGLGAATNAMAALNCFLEAAHKAEGRPLRPLHIVSFENDLDSLRLALMHPVRFPHLKHGAPHALVNGGAWASDEWPVRWTLLKGDFLQKITEAPAPGVIFYDPFSYKADSELWTVESFERVFRACGNHPVELFTYTASTAVRAALLAAGFYVARGAGTGPKQETTIALHPVVAEGPLAYPLLAEEWLARWAASSAKFPAGVAPEAFEALIRNHRQFTRFL